MHGVGRRRHLNKLAATGVSGVIPRLPLAFKPDAKEKNGRKKGRKGDGEYSYGLRGVRKRSP